MSRAVPLARRNLTVEPRRLAASAGGIGLAVMLVLLLDGLWAGVQAQATMYEDHTGADLVVAPGTRNLFSDNSLLPPATPATWPCTPCDINAGQPAWPGTLRQGADEDRGGRPRDTTLPRA